MDKELFGDTFRSPPRLTPLEARAIRLALEFVGPMIAADAHTPLERVRRKLEETFGAVRSRPDAPSRRRPGPRRSSCGRSATGSAGSALVEIEYQKEGEETPLDETRRAVRRSSGSCPTGTCTRGTARATRSAPSGSTGCAARSSSARRFEPREGFRPDLLSSAAVAARIWYSKRDRPLEGRGGSRGRCPTARRSPRRRSAARSGSSARSSATAARRSSSSRRTSGRASRGGRGARARARAGRRPGLAASPGTAAVLITRRRARRGGEGPTPRARASSGSSPSA